MKKITVLYMDGCPYCRNAARAMDELEKAYSAYEAVPVEWIEETREGEKAQAFAKEYYYVPSMFVDGEKLYEAKPGESYEECKRCVEAVFQAAVN
ncbi:glutaredoxin domain-containing protein [uncultured Selenomonas sp.]|uniref:glutaredoxin family protein n=1 Tax=uncultured Selenomonas sp. TaxID=159275 RepID=UPI0028DB4C50|nr:glutaredoxin domain-containing protein [uncultured Selenomonas sp.]